MALTLQPVDFYGSRLRRPLFHDGVRAAYAPSVNGALMEWAREAHWSMGGLNFKRKRLAGKIEGNIKKLQKEARKEIREASNEHRSPKLVTPPQANQTGFDFTEEAIELASTPARKATGRETPRRGTSAVANSNKVARVSTESGRQELQEGQSINRSARRARQRGTPSEKENHATGGELHQDIMLGTPWKSPSASTPPTKNSHSAKKKSAGAPKSKRRRTVVETEELADDWSDSEEDADDVALIEDEEPHKLARKGKRKTTADSSDSEAEVAAARPGTRSSSRKKKQEASAQPGNEFQSLLFSPSRVLAIARRSKRPAVCKALL
eukprot:TRINITY_DN11725_c0_g1_i1.p1 TRINITY_DN11725_c0_g1~~TRINITY_DN11725_c0_g1_i1.p1  ORF type:complete len:324 (-),score=54.22 TRINITY_DN11725_c0_g1_i1:1163-2134(-)